jgi:asparagine synthase (glutamine-hydrolysing)
MCGIVGIINLENQSRVERRLIDAMRDSMIHRGPDDADSFIDQRVAFGHRRLKIIDLSENGRQPMFDLTERVGIVFNGEVYNFQEVRERLVSKGYRFRSQSDTEVILNAYLEYGIDCVHQFVGMFAFALYDRRTGKVHMVRDRLGIKPLYYAQFDGKLIFASEIKAILRYPGFPREADMAAVSSYLSYRYSLGERSLFKNIHSLQPGWRLEIDRNAVSTQQYWNLPVLPENGEDRGEEFYIARVRELLASAVQYRMISDVPVGAYLSGGLDSSVVVAVMSNLANRSVETFTIGFAQEDYNEFRYAKQVADRYKSHHHEILLSPDDYIENMMRLIRFKDGPLSVANEPALYTMSVELKKFITVVLSGEGSDEIFGGYGRIFRSPFDYQRMQEIARNGHSFDPSLIENLRKKYGSKAFSNEVEHFLDQYQYVKWEDKLNFLSSDLISLLDGDRELNQLFAGHFEKLDGLSLYQKYMWIFEKLHIVGLLQRVDTTTMATAVEARVPFVDHRLVEFALSIPVKYKMKWKDQTAASLLNSDQISEVHDIPKYILKKSYEPELPADVIWRRKMGFPVPIHQWFGKEFNDFAKDLLLCDRAKQRGVYNHLFIEKMLNDARLFENHRFGLKVWMLINLELWFREYIDC